MNVLKLKFDERIGAKMLRYFIVIIVFFIGGAASAACGFENSTSGSYRTKVVAAEPGKGRVELLTVPRGSSNPWPNDDFDITVRVLDEQTCDLARATVWYKDNTGRNHDLNTPGNNSAMHRSVWTDTLGRPMFGVLRLRAWRNHNKTLIFVVNYHNAALNTVPGLSVGNTNTIPNPTSPLPIPNTNQFNEMTITLSHVSSFQVEFEIIDLVCNRSFNVVLDPWEELPISICSDGSYGRFSYRDMRNPSATIAALVRPFERVRM